MTQCDKAPEEATKVVLQPTAVHDQQVGSCHEFASAKGFVLNVGKGDKGADMHGPVIRGKVPRVPGLAQENTIQEQALLPNGTKIPVPHVGQIAVEGDASDLEKNKAETNTPTAALGASSASKQLASAGPWAVAKTKVEASTVPAFALPCVPLSVAENKTVVVPPGPAVVSTGAVEGVETATIDTTTAPALAVVEQDELPPIVMTPSQDIDGQMTLFDREDFWRVLNDADYFQRSFSPEEREHLSAQCLYFYGIPLDRLQKIMIAQKLFEHDFLAEEDMLTVKAREALLAKKKKEEPERYNKLVAEETRGSVHTLLLAAHCDFVDPHACEQYWMVSKERKAGEKSSLMSQDGGSEVSSGSLAERSFTTTFSTSFGNKKPMTTTGSAAVFSSSTSSEVGITSKQMMKSGAEVEMAQSKQQLANHMSSVGIVTKNAPGVLQPQDLVGQEDADAAMKMNAMSTKLISQEDSSASNTAVLGGVGVGARPDSITMKQMVAPGRLQDRNGVEDMDVEQLEHEEDEDNRLSPSSTATLVSASLNHNHASGDYQKQAPGNAGGTITNTAGGGRNMKVSLKAAGPGATGDVNMAVARDTTTKSPSAAQQVAATATTMNKVGNMKMARDGQVQHPSQLSSESSAMGFEDGIGDALMGMGPKLAPSTSCLSTGTGLLVLGKKGGQGGLFGNKVQGESFKGKTASSSSMLTTGATSDGNSALPPVAVSTSAGKGKPGATPTSRTTSRSSQPGFGQDSTRSCYSSSTPAFGATTSLPGGPHQAGGPQYIEHPSRSLSLCSNKNATTVNSGLVVDDQLKLSVGPIAGTASNGTPGSKGASQAGTPLNAWNSLQNAQQQPFEGKSKGEAMLLAVGKQAGAPGITTPVSINAKGQPGQMSKSAFAGCKSTLYGNAPSAGLPGGPAPMGGKKGASGRQPAGVTSFSLSPEKKRKHFPVGDGTTKSWGTGAAAMQSGKYFGGGPSWTTSSNNPASSMNTSYNSKSNTTPSSAADQQQGGGLVHQNGVFKNSFYNTTSSAGGRSNTGVVSGSSTTSSFASGHTKDNNSSTTFFAKAATAGSEKGSCGSKNVSPASGYVSSARPTPTSSGTIVSGGFGKYGNKGNKQVLGGVPAGKVAGKCLYGTADDAQHLVRTAESDAHKGATSKGTTGGFAGLQHVASKKGDHPAAAAGKASGGQPQGKYTTESSAGSSTSDKQGFVSDLNGMRTKGKAAAASSVSAVGNGKGGAMHSAAEAKNKEQEAATKTSSAAAAAAPDYAKEGDTLANVVEQDELKGPKDEQHLIEAAHQHLLAASGLGAVDPFASWWAGAAAAAAFDPAAFLNPALADPAFLYGVSTPAAFPPASLLLPAYHPATAAALGGAPPTFPLMHAASYPPPFYGPSGGAAAAAAFYPGAAPVFPGDPALVDPVTGQLLVTGTLVDAGLDGEADAEASRRAMNHAAATMAATVGDTINIHHQVEDLSVVAPPSQTTNGKMIAGKQDHGHRDESGILASSIPNSASKKRAVHLDAADQKMLAPSLSLSPELNPLAPPFVIPGDADLPLSPELVGATATSPYPMHPLGFPMSPELYEHAAAFFPCTDGDSDDGTCYTQDDGRGVVLPITNAKMNKSNSTTGALAIKQGSLGLGGATGLVNEQAYHPGKMKKALSSRGKTSDMEAAELEQDLYRDMGLLGPKTASTGPHASKTGTNKGAVAPTKANATKKKKTSNKKVMVDATSSSSKNASKKDELDEILSDDEDDEDSFTEMLQKDTKCHTNCKLAGSSKKPKNKNTVTDGGLGFAGALSGDIDVSSIPTSQLQTTKSALSKGAKTNAASLAAATTNKGTTLQSASTNKGTNAGKKGPVSQTTSTSGADLVGKKGPSAQQGPTSVGAPPSGGPPARSNKNGAAPLAATSPGYPTLPVPPGSSSGPQSRSAASPNGVGAAANAVNLNDVTASFLNNSAASTASLKTASSNHSIYGAFSGNNTTTGASNPTLLSGKQAPATWPVKTHRAPFGSPELAAKEEQMRLYSTAPGFTAPPPPTPPPSAVVRPPPECPPSNKKTLPPAPPSKAPPAPPAIVNTLPAAALAPRLQIQAPLMLYPTTSQYTSYSNDTSGCWVSAFGNPTPELTRASTYPRGPAASKGPAAATEGPVDVHLPKQPPKPSMNGMQVLRAAILAYFTKYELEECNLDSMAKDADVKAAWKTIGRVPLWKLVKQFPCDMSQRQLADGTWKLWLIENPIENPDSPIMGAPANCETLFDSAASPNSVIPSGCLEAATPVQCDDSPVLGCSAVSYSFASATKLPVPTCEMPSPIASTRDVASTRKADAAKGTMAGEESQGAQGDCVIQ
ncbi:unnamed protein product [Amoebophrya sp. A25]|nr:unnamed protein product [Amoebophrya sp. A25]|eukprot:GSA25T00011818001.1